VRCWALAFTHVPPDVFAAEVDYLWMDAYIPKYLDSQVIRKYRGKDKERVLQLVCPMRCGIEEDKNK